MLEIGPNLMQAIIWTAIVGGGIVTSWMMIKYLDG